MNILMMTQSRTLNVFYDIAQYLEKTYPIDKIGFYVTDSPFFNDFKKKNPDIENSKYKLLKEWEIVRESGGISPDLNLLKHYEEKFGEPYLWNALVADRRIYFGKKYAIKQDYSPRYNHKQMLCILQIALQRIERLIEEVNPDCIFSFHCVTIGDYLSYLFSKKFDIQFLNLRPSRILNYIYAAASIHEPPDFLKNDFKESYFDEKNSTFSEEAIEYLKSFISTHSMYEGVIPASDKPPQPFSKDKNRLKYLKIWKIAGLIRNELKYRFGEYRFDNSVSGFVGPYFYQHIGRPIKAKITKTRLAKYYLNKNDLKNLDYAFFPLHVEPELTLSVTSNPYLNQIEVIRLISHSLPVGMKLIVKEHPVSIGKRPMSYYFKLLEIPNVLLSEPSITSRDLIIDAKLITVIAGSIGLESAMLKKPVVVFGGTPFNILPLNMLRRVTNLNRLGQEIQDLLNAYEYDERALLSYITCIIQNSVGVDFYSRLIGRKEAYREDLEKGSDAEIAERSNQIARLSEYLMSRTQIEKN